MFRFEFNIKRVELQRRNVLQKHTTKPYKTVKGV